VGRQTDGRTSDRYITLTPRRGQQNKQKYSKMQVHSFQEMTIKPPAYVK